MNIASRADISDRVNQLMALGALVLAVLFGVDSAQQVIPPGESGPLAVAELIVKATGLLLVAALLVLIARKWRLAQAGETAGAESFTGSVVRRACTASWVATLVLLTVLAERVLLVGPPQFAVDVTLAVMLGVYAVAFFVFDRAPHASSS